MSWEPCDHIPVYKRIELSQKPMLATATTTSLGEALMDAFADAERRANAERIWKITRQMAEGTNAPAPREDIPTPVDESGWESAWLG